jgi:hypothetical protein
MSPLQPCKHGEQKVRIPFSRVRFSTQKIEPLHPQQLGSLGNTKIDAVKWYSQARRKWSKASIAANKAVSKDICNQDYWFDEATKARTNRLLAKSKKSKD